MTYAEGPAACRNCGRDVEATDRYCPWCGAANRPLDGPENAGPGAAPDASGDELRALRASVNAMSTELGRVSLRLDALERERAAPSGPAVTPSEAPPVAPPPPAALPVTPPSPPAARPSWGAAPAAETPAIPAARREAVAAPNRERREASGFGSSAQPSPAGGGGIGVPRMPLPDFASGNWEWLVGGNWLARIGMVALIFGVAFFISLAIDRGWLGEVERVMLGLAGGLAFLAAGEYWRRRYAVWAQTVTGGGLAILYLSVYGAFALYELISPMTAFGAFSLITLAGAALSLRHESAAVAVFSILGGFATPVLLQDRLPDQRLLLAYVLVLDVGVLALAGLRNWRWFTALAWVGSLFLFAFWQQELDPPVGLAQVGITAIFLIFAGATVAFHVIRQQSSGILDLALVTLNAAAFYGISYFLIYDVHRPWMGGFTVSLAAFYALLAAACRMRGAAQFNLTLFAAGLAVVFAVLVVPVQLGGPWVSVAWGVEGLALLWLSFPLRMRELRWAGYATFIVSAVWLLAVDTPGAFREDLTPFLNLYMLSYGAVVASAVLSAWLLWRKRDGLEGYEQAAYPVFMVGAAAGGAVAVPMQLEWPWVTMAWAGEALLLMGLSFRLQARELRWFGYVMFGVFSAWLLGWDAPRALGEDFTFFLNWHTLNYAVAISAAALAGCLLWQRRDELPGRERRVYAAFALAAGVFAAVAVPVQVSGVWISVGWAAESVALLAASRRLDMPEMRWFGYGLLAAMLGRMLAFDTFDVNPETFRPVLNWRFLAFAAGIAALYSAALPELRRRRQPSHPGQPCHSERSEESRLSLPALLGLANLATLWLFSAEIITSADSAFFGLSDEAGRNVASLGLSLLWTVYAAVLIVVGVARRWRWTRLAGLALLAVPVVKLFAFDSRMLEQEYRVIAFIALGLILVAGGLLYQRYSRVVRGFLFE